jgi:hypothetical protein
MNLIHLHPSLALGYMKFMLGLKLGMSQMVDETPFHLPLSLLLIKRGMLGFINL